MKKEFQAAFQLSKTVVFQVKYYTLLNNSTPHFATLAEKFCRSKRGYIQGGQSQTDLLPNFPVAMKFFKKWDKFHLKNLNEKQYEEMQQDLEKLKERYNFIYEELNESKRPYSPYFGINKLAEFTKQKPKSEKI